MKTKNLTLNVWRQRSKSDSGRFEKYVAKDVNEHMSFLEMLDVVNEELLEKGEEPIAFDHDCREGICGMCGLVINGYAHGPQERTTACQLHMRKVFELGWDELWIEPWRATSFPVIKDLAVDRSAFDRIMQAGGYISIRTGSPPDANEMPIGKHVADMAMDAAECIGCGACVASCKNASAMLFTGAKISQFALVPQGMPERRSRALSMVKAMDAEGFGNCTNERECEGECPKEISFASIARLNREFLSAKFLR